MRLHAILRRSKTRRLLAAMAGGLCLPAWGAPVQSQSTTGGRTPLDAATRRAVVDTIGRQLTLVYVDADTGRLIADHLRRRSDSGAYDAFTDPRRFAETLSNDLRGLNGDGHLSVRYRPDGHATHLGPEGISILTPDPPPTAGQRAEARHDHFGIGRLDVLRGNVGYLNLEEFSPLPLAADAAVVALKYLESTDAIIIDLRQNGGGDGDLSNFLISHFTGPDSILSLRISNRSGHETVDRWTLASVPGPRRVDVPLYLLISRETASAAEDFAFVLHNLGRATLVGERTAGAGHNNVFLDSGHGFITSISFTRVADPRTGREWERVGVAPDLSCDPQRALTVAQADATRQLAAHASGPEQEALSLLHEALDAEIHVHSVPAARLRRYAGSYGDVFTISVRDHGLQYREGHGDPTPLVALSDSVFAVGGNRFIFAHHVQAGIVLRVTPPGGETISLPRVPRHTGRR